MDVPNAIVITVSDRCAAGTTVDRSGPLAAQLLADGGYPDAQVRVVPDGMNSVRTALLGAIAEGARIIVTTGGTGITARDVTPEATATVVEHQLPGVMEEVRRRSAQHVPTALLSRAIAGIVGAAVVINAPGSVGGVTDTLAVAVPLLEHLLSQLDGGNHD